MEHLQEQAHVLEVQTGGRLVEDIEGAPGVALGQLGGQLDPLGFAAGERRGRLAQMEVAESDIVEQLQLFLDAALGAEELQRVRTVRSSTSAMLRPR